jgi:hypothetical protein
VDAVLGGHTLAAWAGDAGGVPFGQAYPFATTALVVDLTDSGAVIAGSARVPALELSAGPRARAATIVRDASRDMVGRIEIGLTSVSSRNRAGYLPDFAAAALRADAECDAAFVLPSAFFTEAPVEGAVARLPAGEVSRLDLHRLFPFPDDGISVIELRPHEFGELVARHDADSNPQSRRGDELWWNWSRTPCGIDSMKENPLSVAVYDYALDLITGWLGRRPAVASRHRARPAFVRAVRR